MSLERTDGRTDGQATTKSERVADWTAGVSDGPEAGGESQIRRSDRLRAGQPVSPMERRLDDQTNGVAAQRRREGLTVREFGRTDVWSDGPKIGSEAVARIDIRTNLKRTDEEAGKRTGGWSGGLSRSDGHERDGQTVGCADDRSGRRTAPK